jgi:hypothetical protein
LAITNAPPGLEVTASNLYPNVQTASSVDGTWIEISSPSPRSSHTAIYDPVRDRMVVFGGGDVSGNFDAVWALSLSGTPAWTHLGPSGSAPTARSSHSAIYDPVRDRIIVFGGNDGSLRNDVWALSLSGVPAWTQLTPSGTAPTGRANQTAIYDPVRDLMVVFGGLDGTYRNDVWTLSLSGTPTWTNLTPSGSAPTERSDHSAIYDSARDRMVVFGGTNGFFLGDVWTLSLSGTPAWTSLSPSGSIVPRAAHTAIYDPVRDRMLVFAGSSISALNDVNALSLSGAPAWTAITPSGSVPGARSQHTAIYDPVRDQMVVFAGLNFAAFNDLWVLSLPGSPAWTNLAPSEFGVPSRRLYHSAIYDPVRDRMVVFGGYDGSYRNDVWAFPLGSAGVDQYPT